jgi:hypothetical protein
MPEIVGRLRTPRLPSAPASPVVGEMYYDTTLNQLLYWNGTAWTASAGGGVGSDFLRYDGAFVAGTYNDGDIVIGSDGVAYLCVVNGTTTPPTSWSGVAGPVGPAGPQGPQGPTGLTGPAGTGIPTPVVNGQWVKGQSGAAVWSAIQQVDLPLTPYAITLPASPFHGQEAILVDSLTNPSYQWRFRYNANSTSTYKWEFIGGAPATSYIDTAEAVTAAVGAYSDLATVGPSFILPRAGEYDLRIDVWASIGAATNWAGVSAIPCVNVVNTWTNPIIQTFCAVQPTAGIQYVTATASGRPAALPAGTLLKVVYGIWSQSGTGAPNFGRRRLYVTPVRVS